MIRSRRSLIFVAASALVLWVVPSLGTEGMGTVGQPDRHPDSRLVEANASDHAAAQLLRRGDRIAEAAILQSQ